LVDGALFGSVRVSLGIEVGSGVLVEGAGGGHGPDRDEHGVFERDDRLGGATACCDPPVLDARVC
jgi:hypothetical protein